MLPEVTFADPQWAAHTTEVLYNTVGRDRRVIGRNHTLLHRALLYITKAAFEGPGPGNSSQKWFELV
jgi:hypothetical protein